MHCHVHNQNSIISNHTSERLFEGLYLKMRTYLRAAQRTFLSTCQELLEVTSETGQLLAMYPAMLGR